MAILLLALFMIFSFAQVTQAACTGSSPSWISTPDDASIRSCVSSASRRDTITVTAGSGTASWGSAVTLTRGISLIGPGRNSLEVSRSGNLITISPDASAIANDEIIKVTGFTFNSNNSAAVMMDINGAGPLGTKPFNKLVIGDNRFKNTTQEAIHGSGQYRGVIYNNIFDRVNQVFRPWGSDDYREQDNGYYTRAFGTADNIYFESNSFTCSSGASGGNPGWVESGQGGRMVIRYNTWNLTNCSQQELWDIHGQQNFSGGGANNGQTGTMVTEIYGNSCVANCNGYRMLNHRGGWGLFFNNTVTGTGAMSVQVNQYAKGDVGGSGCNADMPNPAAGYDGQVNNSYFWNITVNGNLKTVSGAQPIADGCGVSLNNGYWQQNVGCTSAACTTGIGQGTTPPVGSCTVGVGYWVAGTPTVTIDPNVIQNGTFYKCTSTNVWTVYYRPYTYPHPLRSGGSQSTDTTPPSPPANPNVL